MDRIELLAVLIFLDLTKHHVGDLITGVRPDIDDFVVPFSVRDDAAAILLVHLFDLLVRILHFGFFPFGNDHVLDANRDASTSGFLKPELFQFIESLNRNCRAGDLIAAPNDVAELFLARCLIEEPKFFRPNLIKNDATGCCLNYRGVGNAKASLPPTIGVFKQNPIVRLNRALNHREFDFGCVGKQRQMTTILLRRPGILSDVIATQGYVLTWRCNRLTARRRENIVRREHQHARFQLGFDRQGHVHCHLVTIKIGVVSRANERMNPNGFTLDQLWFKRLNRKTVQSRSTIQEHRMTSGYFIKNVPDLGSLAFDHLFRTAYRMHVAEIFEPTNNEWLEKNQRHLLWQTALIQL